MSHLDGSSPDADRAEATQTGTDSDQEQQSTMDSTPAPVPEWMTRATCAHRILDPLIARARAAGPLPELGSPEWAAAEPMTLYAVAFAALLAHLNAMGMGLMVAARDRREEPYRVQREASYAISAALDWAAESRRPSHVELERRRAEVVRP